MIKVERVEFMVPGLEGNASATDLQNILVGISGVARVDLDAAQHTITVEYDPDYVDPVMLKNSVKGSGYPMAEPEGRL
jgi:copper chaperone CopZ